MPKREVCIDCQKPSPETETTYTLISARYGWRLTRTRGPDGHAIVEWRCRECWKKFKDEPNGVASTPLPPSTRR